jgi:hypothetical protein
MIAALTFLLIALGSPAFCPPPVKALIRKRSRQENASARSGFGPRPF